MGISTDWIEIGKYHHMKNGLIYSTLDQLFAERKVASIIHRLYIG